MKLCFLVNPYSGKNQSLKIFQSIKPLLNQKNIDIDFYKTEYKEHAIEIVKKIELNTYNALIIIGGDGTFHEVVTALMKRKDNQRLPIGIIPGGSGNSFLYETNNMNPLSILKKIIELYIKSYFKKKNYKNIWFFRTFLNLSS